MYLEAPVAAVCRAAMGGALLHAVQVLRSGRRQLWRHCAAVVDCTGLPGFVLASLDSEAYGCGPRTPLPFHSRIALRIVARKTKGAY